MVYTLYHCEVLTFCIYVQRMCEVDIISTHSMHIFCRDTTMRVICGEGAILLEKIHLSNECF